MTSRVVPTGFRRFSATAGKTKAADAVSGGTSGVGSRRPQKLPSFKVRGLGDAMDHAVHMVRSHDPSGFLPGRLLPTTDMKETYYAVRSFWVETGLRFGTTANVPPHSSPAEHLRWWQDAINHVYNDQEGLPDTEPSDPVQPRADQSWDHPTLELLQKVVSKHNLSKHHFDDVLRGRLQDLDLKQYKTLDDLVSHAELSCGSLLDLVLESGDVRSPEAFQAARALGIAHGLTNALRLSIPVMSTTGKLIIPEELCVKHGVESPRYLLSALGMGDEKGRLALQAAVQDIATEARRHLGEARELRETLLEQPDGNKAVAAMLPGLASETFLDRLGEKEFNLTDRNLRNVGLFEQTACAAKMVGAYFRRQY